MYTSDENWARKTSTWVVCFLLSIACLWAAHSHFTQAFPIVSLDIQLDRGGAVDSALEIVEREDWGPKTFEQAASFQLDRQVQHFVELECGGNKAFIDMLSANLYAPYQWRVRHFQPDNAHEVMLFFAPSGEWYGVEENIPEEESGAALNRDDALIVAQTRATDLGIELAAYERISDSQKEQPSGRIDHTFVYELLNKELGTGRYRLKLVVSGDRLTTLKREVFVPEAFERRYAEMRSANETIAMVGSGAMFVLFVIGGAIGTFFLLRQGWVQWRTAVFWGTLLGALQGLAMLNELPLSWMTYDTALSPDDHIVQTVFLAAIAFVGMAQLYTLSFIVAETMTRRAFPNHLQFWKLWSKEVGSSLSVMGRTAGGYLMVGPMILYVVGVYYLNSRWLGWWNPSEALFEPNILASYFPWFSSIALSLQAGFWEECLFRAIPLSGAALIGERFGRKRMCIGIAFVLQMLIFGAAHANYPAQPAYARMLELLIPSAVFGWLFLKFGLLPSIIMHFAYDVVWFALPLFVSKADGIFVDRSIVLFLAFIPLLIPLYQRYRIRNWNELTDEFLNSAWKPVIKIKEETTLSESMSLQPISKLVRRSWIFIGFVGFGMWFYATDFDRSVPSLKIDREQAIAVGYDWLNEQGFKLKDDWHSSAIVDDFRGQSHTYVWREFGEDAYDRLLGSFLSAPHWDVRFVRFDENISVEDRAEEFIVEVSSEGKVLGLFHKVPEGRQGVSLDEESGRLLAFQVLSEKFRLGKNEIELVSADPKKRPERRDWRFVFRQPDVLSENSGQTQLSVDIAGDIIVSVDRFVEVPEKWQREEREREQAVLMASAIGGGCLILIVIAITIYAIISWSRGLFSFSIFAKVGVGLCVWGYVSVINSWPGAYFNFTTTDPFLTQIIMKIAGAFLLVSLFAFVTAVLSGASSSWNNRMPIAKVDWILGLAIAFAWKGLGGAMSLFPPESLPEWPAFFNAANYFSWWTGNLSLHGYFFGSSILMALIGITSKFTDNWRKRVSLGYIALIIVGFCMQVVGQDSFEKIAISGVIGALLILLSFLTVLRNDIRLSWIVFGVFQMSEQIRDAITNPFDGAFLGSVLFGLIIAVLAYWFSFKEESFKGES